MAIDVGAEVVIKATQSTGVAKQSNGHASRGGLGVEESMSLIWIMSGQGMGEKIWENGLISGC